VNVRRWVRNCSIASRPFHGSQPKSYSSWPPECRNSSRSTDDRHSQDFYPSVADSITVTPRTARSNKVQAERFWRSGKPSIRHGKFHLRRSGGSDLQSDHHFVAPFAHSGHSPMVRFRRFKHCESMSATVSRTRCAIYLIIGNFHFDPLPRMLERIHQSFVPIRRLVYTPGCRAAHRLPRLRKLHLCSRKFLAAW